MFRCILLLAAVAASSPLLAQSDSDNLRELQFQAVESKTAAWAHWGDRPNAYSSWTNHSNRLIPAYGFGIKFGTVAWKNSLYRDPAKVEALYGYLPEDTVNPEARYFDQTDIYTLLKQAALEQGKKHVFLMVFDGMDWETTRAAALYRNRKLSYSKWKGHGLAFQDYTGGDPKFAYCVTSPHNGDTKFDVNAQVVTVPGSENRGGYSATYGGPTPWDPPGDPGYLLGKRRSVPHAFTDSASSATSLNAGVKTFNGAINIDPEGKQVTTLAHQLQEQGWGIGVVTSVPISHATPAAVYSHNVTRDDYQDLTRDLLGRPSISHRDPLSGVDVLIGCGWGESRDDERKGQGNNYIPGNRYLADDDLQKIDARNGGRYVVAQRTAGKSGAEILAAAADEAASGNHRLFGFFGVEGGHLPYQTADGKYDPTRGVSQADRYTPADIQENPTLADMTRAALQVLEKQEKGFYLMVEAGDVDWANHNNNIDDSVGAVFSGEAAFTAITDWVESHSNWEESCLILTADHGHMLVIDDPRALTGELQAMDREAFNKTRAAAGGAADGQAGQ